MDPRQIVLLVALTLVTVAAETPRPRLIDFNPWAWLPTNRNRSPTIMDYFFPPSRTPKHSILDPPADRTPPDSIVSQPSQEKTTPEMLTTVSTRKSSSTAGKTKSTSAATIESVPFTATIPPITKKHSPKTSAPPITTIEVKKHSQKTSAAPETTIDIKTTQALKIDKNSAFTTTSTSSSTAKPTKRYTIRPVIKNTEKPTVTQTETTLNTESDSTETEGDITDTTGTTYSGTGKDTWPTLSTVSESRSTDIGSGTTLTVETSTGTSDATAADAADSREGYLPLRDKPQQTKVKINDQTKKETVPLPAGSASVLAKPTKYHYYPHNQHLYFLPECAIQQVCNAVYVRLNYTQPLCACPSRYRDPCSASLNADDLHTLRLTTDSKKKYAHKAVTLVKTCEAVSEMRECRAPRDWSLLALQNIRTGKSHYLVICRCPESHILEGPMSHDQPTYASVPGIRVYGMMCVRPTSYQTAGYSPNRYTPVTIQSTTSAYKVDYSQPHYSQDKPAYNRFTSHSYLGPNYYNRMSRVARVRRMAQNNPPFPWYKVREFASTIDRSL